MPLSREELETMQKTLKEVFDLAKDGFEANKHYGPSDPDVQRHTKTLVKTSAALLRIDTHLHDLDDAANTLTKLPAPRMPGQQL